MARNRVFLPLVNNGQDVKVSLRSDLIDDNVRQAGNRKFPGIFNDTGTPQQGECSKDIHNLPDPRYHSIGSGFIMLCNIMANVLKV